MSADMLASMTPEELANMPLMPNPTGGPSNFDNPYTSGPDAVIVLSVFLAIATSIVFMRIWSRLRIVKRLGWDDACAVIALVFVAVVFAIPVYLIEIRIMGPHSWDVRFMDFMQPRVQVMLVWVIIVSILANCFAKLSILLLVYRLFPRTVAPKTSYCILFGIFANVVASLITIIYICASCLPRIGSHGVKPAKCDGRYQTNLGIGTAAVNAVLDFYILAISLPSLWMLQMPIKKKFSVVGVLAVGLAACTLSLMTLANRANTDTTYDPTHSQVYLFILTVLEPMIAIIAASLPALPALWAELSTNGAASVRRLLSKFSMSSLNSSKGRSMHIADEESSLKSLQTHNLTRSSDAEQGYKEPFHVTSNERAGF